MPSIYYQPNNITLITLTMELYTEIQINASPERVWRMLTDFASSYKACRPNKMWSADKDDR